MSKLEKEQLKRWCPTCEEAPGAWCTYIDVISLSKRRTQKLHPKR
jgi:hypothetical protein